MPSPGSDAPSDEARLARFDDIMEKFDQMKAVVNRERKRMDELKQFFDATMEGIGGRIDTLSDQWTDLVAKQQETMEMQIDHASKSLPEEPSDDARLARFDDVMEKFDQMKTVVNRERKRMDELNQFFDATMERIGGRIDTLSDQWTDLVAKQQETMEMQIDHASKSLPEEPKEPLSRAQLENLKKQELPKLKVKVYRAKTLHKDAKEVHNRANSEWKLLTKSLKDMTEVEKKQQEMINQWTVGQKMTVEQAKATVMNTVDKLNELGDKELAKELKTFLESLTASSSASSASGSSTTGCHSQKQTSSVLSSTSETSIDGCHYRI